MRRPRPGTALSPVTRVLAVIVMALGGTLLPVTAATAASSALFTVRDHRIAEASGIARGVTSPGVYYVQNDSGDRARFFAVDGRTGRVRAVYDVPDAANRDWEDLAVAPDADGTSSVWLADIGDNGASREQVQLYRVDEPRVDMSTYDARATTGRPDVWRLRYPSGPVNAESLAVDPHGRAYLVTKNESGRSAVFAVPPHPDAGRVQVLTRIGSVVFRAGAALLPPSLQRSATGGALSPDGSVLVVRTYTQAALWHVRGGDVARALRTAPTRISLPLQLQGEGVCIDGARLVLDSEQVPSAVLAVPLPPGFAAAAPSSSAASPPATSAASSAVSSASGVPSPSPSGSVPPSGSRSLSLTWRVLLAAASLAAGVAALVRMRRRRRSR